MTIGLPRSGKSTWARKQGLPIVNPDSIRLAIHGEPFLQEMEAIVWWVAKIMVGSLFIVGHDKIILDATNITKERRKFWHNPSWEIELKWFFTDKDTCIKRAIKDKKDYLIPIIEEMDKNRS